IDGDVTCLGAVAERLWDQSAQREPRGSAEANCVHRASSGLP
ncbi:MAG: hypothetical protein RIT23_517, partial [Actinomycetota bacterium]